MKKVDLLNIIKEEIILFEKKTSDSDNEILNNIIIEFNKKSKLIKLQVSSTSTTSINTFVVWINHNDKYMDIKMYKPDGGAWIYLSKAFYSEIDNLGKKYNKSISWNNSRSIGWIS